MLNKLCMLFWIRYKSVIDELENGDYKVKQIVVSGEMLHFSILFTLRSAYSVFSGIQLALKWVFIPCLDLAFGRISTAACLTLSWSLESQSLYFGPLPVYLYWDIYSVQYKTRLYHQFTGSMAEKRKPKDVHFKQRLKKKLTDGANISWFVRLF